MGKKKRNNFRPIALEPIKKAEPIKKTGQTADDYDSSSSSCGGVRLDRPLTPEEFPPPVGNFFDFPTDEERKKFKVVWTHDYISEEVRNIWKDQEVDGVTSMHVPMEHLQVALRFEPVIPKDKRHRGQSSRRIVTDTPPRRLTYFEAFGRPPPGDYIAYFRSYDPAPAKPPPRDDESNLNRRFAQSHPAIRRGLSPPPGLGHQPPRQLAEDEDGWRAVNASKGRSNRSLASSGGSAQPEQLNCSQPPSQTAEEDDGWTTYSKAKSSSRGTAQTGRYNANRKNTRSDECSSSGVGSSVSHSDALVSDKLSGLAFDDGFMDFKG